MIGMGLVGGEGVAGFEAGDEDDVGAGVGGGKIEADLQMEEAGDFSAQGFEFFADEAGVIGLGAAEGGILQPPHHDVGDHGGIRR